MNQKTIISIDAMGGDLGPTAVIEGIAKAVRKNANLRFVVNGQQDQLSPLIAAQGLTDVCTIRHADGVVTMHDKPSQVMRHGLKTSMWSTIDAVRNGEAAVAVSCGNTGALMAVSMLRLRKLPGVDRPAIAGMWPSFNPKTGWNIVLDMGADVRAEARDLLAYALMGAAYAHSALGLERPRIGLLNVGTEEHKGNAELRLAHDMISAAQERADFEFVGFVEGNDIPSARVDVIVTDGFTGNVALKTGEGTAKMASQLMKEALTSGWMAKLGAILAMGALRKLKERIDPRRANGGVFLGLNGTVVKSHGSADATGIAAAIDLAARLSASRFLQGMAARVATGTPTRQDAAIDKTINESEK